MWLLLLVTCVLAAAHDESVGDTCTMTDNKPGECVRLRDCPDLFAKSQQRPIPGSDRRMLRALMLKCRLEPVDKFNPGVCCNIHSTSDPVPSNWTNEPECGLVDSLKSFTIDAYVGDFPWLALLGYKTGNRIEFNCGGSLINKRWVLTAAHCITGNLRNVRFGEHNLNQNPDCLEDYDDEYCYPEPVDVDILRVIRHPYYVRKTVINDIALVELAAPLTFTEEVKPICLPVAEAGQLSSERLSMTVAGWGRTEDPDVRGSQVLKKLMVPVSTQARCEAADKSRTITNKQICVGGERRMDMCNGDSGGPLMFTTLLGGRNRWTQLGVISFGPDKCGSPGVPSVHTRVAAYLGWISSVVNA